MKTIPQSGEVRPGDVINVVGAAGPMGVMHVVRNACSGVPGLRIFAGDLDEERLAALTRIAAPLAKDNSVAFSTYNPKAGVPGETASYTIVMVPAPGLAATAVNQSAEDGIINIFAGIPADVSVDIDLNAYIEKRLYFIGTSGSTLDDMKRVLAKVESRALNTNLSVAAVCGLDGAMAGMRAIEERRISGKIIVYPSCHGLDLVRLEEMGERLPGVAKLLDQGMWTGAAEKALVAVCWG
jgi:D-arabinose 1-dehydrogenase-like Zn-dependent alcohol dehydrogenase